MGFETSLFLSHLLVLVEPGCGLRSHSTRFDSWRGDQIPSSWRTPGASLRSSLCPVRLRAEVLQISIVHSVRAYKQTVLTRREYQTVQRSRHSPRVLNGWYSTTMHGQLGRSQNMAVWGRSDPARLITSRRWCESSRRNQSKTLVIQRSRAYTQKTRPMVGHQALNLFVWVRLPSQNTALDTLG